MEEEKIGKTPKPKAKDLRSLSVVRIDGETSKKPRNSRFYRFKDLAPGRVIDTYAAQCDKCYKWRVIDSQDEYEEVRSKMLEDPFNCQKKEGRSCEEDADIDYDSSRTWVIDKPGIPKTPKGFKRSLVLRKDYSKMDTYYITPTGKKLRSRNEIAAFVDANPEFKNVAPLGDFNFTVPKVMEDTIPSDVKLASPVAVSSEKRISKQ